jgi:hypothetical protein
MPCRESDVEYMEVVDPNKLDEIRVKEWLDYDEGVIWHTSGWIIINSYSDYVIIVMQDAMAKEIFEYTTAQLFDMSESLFTSSPDGDQPLHVFMAEIRETWKPGNRISI